jgi:hypothetical protein
MTIIHETYERVGDKVVYTATPNKNIFVRCCLFLFELINHQHYKLKYNGKKRYKTIKILGLRRALVDDLSQRSTVKFLFKIGNKYI